MSFTNTDNLPTTNDQTVSKKTLKQIRPWLYKPKKSRFGTRRNLKYNDQHWTAAQKAKYAQFVKLYVDLIKSDSTLKRKYHFNRILSKFMETRSPIQCRSHHQRMLKIYGTPQAILKQVGLELDKILSQTQKSVKTNEIQSVQEKTTEFITLPGFQDYDFQKKQSSNIQLDLQMLDSNEFIINQFGDICQF